MMRKFFQRKQKAFHSTDPELEAYFQQFKVKRKGNTPISDLSFVVLDTETTSIQVKKAQLLSIGAIRVNHQGIHVPEVFEAQFAPLGPSTSDSIPIHGIIPENISKQLMGEDTLKAFLGFLGDAILVGHHIQYDVEMLNKYSKQYWGFPIQNARLDTNVLATRALGAPNLSDRPYSLDELCQYFSIKMHDRHTASGDAFLTAQLFIKILPLLQRKGVQTLEQLLSRGIKRYAY